MLQGQYLLHKPKGPSSFEMIRQIKRQFSDEERKSLTLGHGGTLDPFAEGLLLVLVGQATRLMEYFHTLPKTYLAEVAWGAETDSGDLLGLPVRSASAPTDRKEMEETLKTFLGWHDQIPPTTSAKKINGVSAYKLVHQGIIPVMKSAPVYLHEAQLLSNANGRSLVRITCRGGFYVRSLIRDWARSMGSAAHLYSLKREQIASWNCPQDLGGIEQVPTSDLLPWCSSRIIDAVESERLSKGQRISIGEIKIPNYRLPQGFPEPKMSIKAISVQGQLVSLLELDGNELRPTANLRGGL